MTRSLALPPLALIALLGAGCQRDEAPIPAPSVEASEPAAKAKTTLSSITWPDEAAIDARALSALSAEARAAVDRSPVPVLVVPPAFDLASASVLARGAWYALSVRSPGLTIALFATNLAHEYPAVPPARGRSFVRGDRGFITQNEGIWSVSWIERGASYKLDLECASPDDAPCQDDTFVRELAESLVYVGGASARSKP